MKKYIILAAIILQTGTSTMATTAEQIFENGLVSSAHNGIEVRKGTIKALIENAIYLDKHLINPSDPKVFSSLKDIRDSIQGLNAVGIFETFLPVDWLQEENKPGNIMVAVLYLQQFPKELTKDIKRKLISLSPTVPSLLRNEISKLLKG